ncbi:MAG TPA: YdcH family protein [Aridibacter sp.]|nr:YdcH family protein [Aridibacter sp.]
MDISTTESVKEVLMKESQTFRDLVHQHESYEERLSELASLTYPSESEQIEEVTIKKKKLNVKDEIYSMMTEYQKSH